MSIILKAENISKQYRLGNVGTGTLGHDLNRWWHTVRGKEDPYLKIGGLNDRSVKATEDYVWAIQDINFEVKPGELLGIIGKNGAGKSTLLKILSRVTSPTTGSIKTRGRIASLLEVGTGFHGELTGRENIYMNGTVLGMNRAEINRKIDEIIDFSGCEKYIDTPVKRYSSGMTVRLGFAVAAHLEPEILVVDEVLAVGDAEFQKKAIGKMQDLSTGQGRTVLFVSHNMGSIKRLCTRGLVLENGKIAFDGDVEESVNNYLLKNQFNNNLKLIERQDRIGSGKLKIRDLKFYNKDKEQVSGVISGDCLIVEVEVEKFKKIRYDKLIISIAFLDNNENTILLFSSDEIGCDFSPLEVSDFFKLNIPTLYLRGGDYQIRVVIAEGLARPENFVDVMGNVATIKVVSGDLYKNKKQNRALNQAIIPGFYEF